MEPSILNDTFESLMAKRIDGVELCGAEGGIETEEDPHCGGKEEGKRHPAEGLNRDLSQEIGFFKIDDFNDFFHLREEAVGNAGFCF